MWGEGEGVIGWREGEMKGVGRGGGDKRRSREREAGSEKPGARWRKREHWDEHHGSKVDGCDIAIGKGDKHHVIL